MEIRQLTEFADFADCQEVQKAAWGFAELDVVPTHLLKALADKKDPWSIQVGAYEAGKMLGFAFCLHTSRPDTLLLHMLAVVPQQQSKNVGFELMQKTAELARARNCTKIVWTYDPMQSANARLYLHKLGATVKQYAEDYYPANTSVLHSGELPADRLKVEWDLENSRRELGSSQNLARVEIPVDFHSLKLQNPQKAKEVLLNVRKQFSENMQRGYEVVDYVYDKSRNVGEYLFVKSN